MLPSRNTAAAVSLLALSIASLIGACAVGSDQEDPPDTASDAGRIDAGGGGTPLPGADSGGDPKTDASTSDAKTDSPTTDACAAALAKIAYDFESGAAGWTHGISDGAAGAASWPFDPWVTGTASVGPACKSGKCYGPALTKNYAQCQRGYLLSPSIDLSACSGRNVSIVFQHAYSFWTGAYNATTWYDGGVVEVSGDGTTWKAVTGTFPGTVKINPDRGASYKCVLENNFGVHNKPGYVGVQTATVRAELAIPSTAITNQTRVRFSFASGVSSTTTDPDVSRGATAPGWRIDDVGFVVK